MPPLPSDDKIVYGPTSCPATNSSLSSASTPAKNSYAGAPRKSSLVASAVNNDSTSRRTDSSPPQASRRKLARSAGAYRCAESKISLIRCQLSFVLMTLGKPLMARQTTGGLLDGNAQSDEKVPQ